MSSLPVRRIKDVAAPQPVARPVACDIVLAVDDPVFGDEIRIPARAHSLAGFREWVSSDDSPEHGRICFLDGEIWIDMSREELETHSKVKVEVTFGLHGLNKKLQLGELYIDGARVSAPQGNFSTIPDGVFLSWKSLESGRVRLVPRKGVEGEYTEVEGPPDLTVEVISKSSVGKDKRRLRRLYHRAGVPEYWLINARGEEIDFQILVREEEDYAPAEILRGGWQASPLFQRQFRLTRRRGRMEHWEYTLQVRQAR